MKPFLLGMAAVCLLPSSLPAQSVFNVRDYGALGDDTGNDGPAIQQAIDAAAPGGGIVFFPSGTYRMTSGVTVPGGVTLEGVGWNANRIPSDRGSWIHITAPMFVPVTLQGDGSGARLLRFFHDQPFVPAAGEECPGTWEANADYPFTIEVDGSDVHLEDIALMSAARGVRQTGGSRLTIRRLGGQAFVAGIVIEESSGPAFISDVGFGTSFSSCQAVAEYSFQNLEVIVLYHSQHSTLRNITVFRAMNGLVLRSNVHGSTTGLQVTNFDCDRCEAGILVEADGAEATITNVDLKGDEFFQDDFGLRVDAENTTLRLDNVHVSSVGRSAIRVDGAGSQLFIDGLWAQFWSDTPGTPSAAVAAGPGASVSVGFTRLFGSPGSPTTAGTVELDP